MIVSAPSQGSVEAVFDVGTTGLVGTGEWRIDDNQGATVLGPSALNVAEIGASGIYVVTFTAPGAEGQFSILFSDDATFDEGTVAVEDLLVTDAELASSLPPLVPSEGTSPQVGPCSLWTTVDAIAECCGETSSTNEEYETVAVEATQFLYELSTRKFGGLCERKVRPQPHRAGCGCASVSIVRLAGRPIRSIVEVKIDGDVVAPDTYKLTRKGLLRVRDPADVTTKLFWPCTQELDLADTEEDTFSIRYLHGMDPPVLGQRAAAELACHLYRACLAGTGGGTCALPSGVVKVVKQNATIEMRPFVNWGYDPRRGWETGMRLVDAFLNAYNPYWQRRRPAVWSPDVDRFPQADPFSVV